MAPSFATIIIFVLFLLAFSPVSSARPFLSSDSSLLSSFHFRDFSSFNLPSSDTLLSSHADFFFYSKPVRFFPPSPPRHPVSFSSFFSFAPDLGNGLAFVISPDADDSYSRLSSLTHAFAVRFGSELTEQVAGQDSKNSSHVLVMTSNLPIRLRNDDKLHAWIDYNSLGNLLEVRLSKSPRFRPWRPVFSQEIDLSDICKDEMFVGFSSSAGRFNQKPAIYSWTFTTRNGFRHSIPASSFWGRPFHRFLDWYRPGYGITFIRKMDDLLCIGISLVLGALCAFVAAAGILLFWSFIRHWTNPPEGEAVMQPILLGYQQLPSEGK